MYVLFSLMYICMIINGLEIFDFFHTIYVSTKENKIIIMNFSSKYQPILSIFLAYNLTCILKFAIYDWHTKHLAVPLVNSRMTLRPRGLNFICCIFTWKLILYIDDMWLLFLLTFVFKDLYFLHGLFRCLETKL